MTVYGYSREPDQDRPVLAGLPERGQRFVRLGAAVIVVGLLFAGGVAGGLVGASGSPRTHWSAAATPSAVPSVEPSTEPDTITLSGVGDVIMGSAPGDLPPHAGAGFFDQVTSALAADLVMGNLETPLTEDTGRVKCVAETPSPTAANPSPSPVPAAGCHQFYLPPSYAQRLSEAGFQVMNLANNHTNDMGKAGLANTRAALESAGVQHTGAPGQITVVRVKGVRVAVLGFSIYGWTQSLNNIPAAVSLVKKAATQADLVVVQMQGGAEGATKSHVPQGHEIFLGEDRGDLRAFTHAVIDAGADVVFGHGPHIMRGMEFYQGRLIAYSLGNFCGYGVLSSSGYLGVGGVLRVTLRRDGSWVDGSLVATHMVSGGLPAPDAKRRALDFVAGLSRDDFGDQAAGIDATGVITAPAG